jgi:hypothetical protein
MSGLRRGTRLRWLVLLLLSHAAGAPAASPDNFAHLHGVNPYYPHRDFPKLTTPQWFGEPGVDAVVLLSIDDMRDPAKYEAFLRPILDRLKAACGRAPLSIFANLFPADPLIAQWQAEGLSIETHTRDHPCPLLGTKGLAWARETYDACVDWVAGIPGCAPVAFRMPCCDSMNSTSPRYFAAIFNATTPAGNYLALDSSVFNLTTEQDRTLPRAWVRDAAGRERFRKYLPFPSFVNTIEDYPYPYVIGGRCWEFPCTVPSDWEAQHLNKPNAETTLEDLKRGMDVAVHKQGIFNFVFHPHNWIRNDQVAALVDYAATAYGDRVRFITFREAEARLREHLLGGHPLRAPDGGDHGVRLLDLDADGYQDIVIAHAAARQTRLWKPRKAVWETGDFPLELVDAAGAARNAQFGRVQGDTILLYANEATAERSAWRFTRGTWCSADALWHGLEGVYTDHGGYDAGTRLLDVDGDGSDELLASLEDGLAVYGWSALRRHWKPLHAPEGAPVLTDALGRDNGLRFYDLDNDGDRDLVYANAAGCGVWRFDGRHRGWTRLRLLPRKGGPAAGLIPPITMHGEEQGAWFHSGKMWWQNEHTANLPEVVDRRSASELLQLWREEPPE